MDRAVLPGRPHPLGATWSRADDAVNFAIYSERATAVWLCLFDDEGREERIAMLDGRGHTWHRMVPQVGVGQRYGYRAEGPYEPAAGLRFNPGKLLVDPYARAVVGELNWDAPILGFRRDDPAMDLSFDPADDAWGVPKGVVVEDGFDWGDDAPPKVPWQDSIIYEMHVKGFTQQHPDIPEALRGTYAGLAHPVAVEYLRALGVTAVELLPIHAAIDEYALFLRRLRNYWGYSTLSYFAPNPRYAATRDPEGQLHEFKAMVKALHQAGIEVILDVVYNHTCEGNEFGPTLSLRGIDNTTYYKLAPGRERYYVDYTGTGNSLNVQHPQVLKLIMDSLRYWVTEMHVDGFRFDLASALARELHDVDRLAAFFDIIHQDPVISQVKLIAEPWDVGEGGYQVGNFPVLWAEWNGKYRDTVRRFWRGDQSHVDDLAYRLTGSSDLYGEDGRGPLASINFVTAHDGFTLADLVSYTTKNNDANGDHNRDGADDNYSANHGVEGSTSHPGILNLRARQMRNLLATMLFSQGVPMLSGGDEIGRTQLGNNNAYCQDNELSWHDWDLDASGRSLLKYTRGLIRLRARHHALRRTRFFYGRPVNDSSQKDITWLRPDGHEMMHYDWSTTWVQSIGALMIGDALDEIDALGRPLHDATLLLLLNASEYPMEFVLPTLATPGAWVVEADTSEPCLPPSRQLAADADRLDLMSRTLVLLRRVDGAPRDEPAEPQAMVGEAAGD